MEASSNWLSLPGSSPDPGGGGLQRQTDWSRTYSGIASINKSTRDNKNILEVRLERSEGARFNLSKVF